MLTPFRAAEKRYKSSVHAEEALSPDGPVPRIPGLVVLPAFLSPDDQRRLVRFALAEHARPPNETSLDAHYRLPSLGLWNAYLAARDDPLLDLPVLPKALLHHHDEQQQSGPRRLVDNSPAHPDSFPAIASTPKPPPAPSPTVPSLPISSLIYKLRWANIGWYYHWGTKMYDFSRGKGHIDDLLRRISKKAVHSVRWEHVFTDGWDEWKSWKDSYEPDAGIINFYQPNDTLMAHIDKSELCPTSPLVSMSLGCSAIFLIGGPTRQVEPIPILLRSGDLLIMAGPECRRAFHGVPRILEGTCPHHLLHHDDHDDWEPYADFMKTTRINVNLRQVFPKGFDPNCIVLT